MYHVTLTTCQINRKTYSDSCILYTDATDPGQGHLYYLVSVLSECPGHFVASAVMFNCRGVLGPNFRHISENRACLWYEDADCNHAPQSTPFIACIPPAVASLYLSVLLCGSNEATIKWRLQLDVSVVRDDHGPYVRSSVRLPYWTDHVINCRLPRDRGRRSRYQQHVDKRYQWQGAVYFDVYL